MSRKDDRLDALRARIPQVAPAQALAAQARGARLVDVREPDEIEGGVARGALALGRGFLEMRIEEEVPDPSTPLIVYCAAGLRSLFAAEALAQMGYREVSSLSGGLAAWRAAGLPMDQPVLTADQRERYDRHLRLPEIGLAGQRRLLAGRVLVIGAGGLGSPALLYLAAAGVGRIGVVDDDRVERSNLQRQVLHTEAAVGTAKVASAARALAALNPGVEVDTHRARLTPDNAERLIADYDVVVDGTDNFATRYLVNDVCVRLGKPLVYGSVFRFEGQVSVFWPGGGGPCYRCLFPAPPPPELAPPCGEAGVLGVLPGLVGLLQATEALKIVAGFGEPLLGRLLTVDALRGRFTPLAVSRDPRCPCCAEGAAFEGAEDYAARCAGPPAD